jgi:hypothetical protein
VTPSGPTIQLTIGLSPVKVASALPCDRSHALTVWSSEAEKRRRPCDPGGDPRVGRCVKYPAGERLPSGCSSGHVVWSGWGTARRHRSSPGVMAALASLVWSRSRAKAPSPGPRGTDSGLSPGKRRGLSRLVTCQARYEPTAPRLPAGPGIGSVLRAADGVPRRDPASLSASFHRANQSLYVNVRP